ncbi:MAG TPA: phosphoglycerate dehydrogenase [Candidatus Sulfobium mesophilum]|nr:phosphoglycerate dehydrogenase [Candidatus Sulfobium mesophilum]
MSYKVLVTDQIDEIAVKILRGCCEVDYKPVLPAEDLRAIIKDYDALMIRSSSKVTRELISDAERLKVIGRAGVGVDNVDLDAATDKGIVVINSPEGNTVAASEHTIGMMLSTIRHIPSADASVKDGRWERSRLMGQQVFNKTIGIIGLGKVGGRVASVAKAMGMRVLVYDPFVGRDLAEELGATYVTSLDDIWKSADFITLHVPKNKVTLNLINKDTIARMKKGVIIINCARGGIINEADLAEAIQNGQVEMAAVDVFDKEPPEGSPLLKLGDKVVLTPHLGASTKEAQINVAVDVAEQIRDISQGLPARSAVNIPSLKPEILGPVKHYMGLAENLGALARQITDGAAREIEIVACGELAALDVSPLVIAVVKGVLCCSSEGVNYVNAPRLAERRGIHVKKSASTNSESYVSLLKVVLTTDKETNKTTGTILGEDIPRILRLAGYQTSIEPAEHMLVLPHKDKPGMVAQVATLLSGENINISMMQVGRKVRALVGGESVMILNVDEPVSDETLVQLQKIDGIYSAKYVNLAAK